MDRPQWDWIGASVDVNITVSEGARAPGDHLAVNAYMMPPTEAMSTYHQSSFVHPGASDNNHDQTAQFAVTDVHPRPDPLLRTYSVYFGKNDDSLDASDIADLDAFVRTFEGAPSDPRSHPTQVQVIGYASARGSESYNRALAQRRADAVKTYLGSHGWTNVAVRISTASAGEAGADPANPDRASDRRVDLIVDNNDDQVVINHEFGHAFGLGDEYAVADSSGAAGWISGTGRNAGTAVSHDAMVKQMRDEAGVSLPGAIAENNDSIMSLGNVVRPQHYAPFHEALRELTGVDEWSLGAPTTTRSAVASAIQGQSGPGDFPVPSGDTRTA